MPSYRIKRLVPVLFALTVLAAGSARADSYDLLHVDLPEGTKVELKDSFETRMDMTMTMPGMGAMTQQMVMVAAEESVDTFVKIEDGIPVEIRRAYGTRSRNTTASMMGQEQKMSQASPLANKVVTFVREGDHYALAEGHSVSGEAGMAELEGERSELMMLYLPSGIFPADEVSVGDSWEMDSTRFESFLQAMQIQQASGKAVSTFVALEELNGEKVAVVKTEFKVRGKWIMEQSQSLSASLDMTMTNYRSLDKGIDLKVVSKGTLSGEGSMAQQGATMEVSLKAPIDAVSIATVRN